MATLRSRSGYGDPAVGSDRRLDAVEFEQWVGPHLAAMASLAARMVGAAGRDDVLQDAVARAWQKWHTFDADRGSARGWLCAIVADQARRVYRKRARARRNIATAPRTEVVSGPDGMAVDLERALATLPTRMRLAVDAYYFADLSVAQTAEIMSISEGTVKSTLAAARVRLRRSLEEVGDDRD